jgi:transcriptional regulatory protein RtcR
MKTVVIGLLGVSLDASGKASSRWEKWRPSVSLCQQEDLLVDRFELLHPPNAEGLAHTVARDIRTVSPETQVVLHPIAMPNAWDFE